MRLDVARVHRRVVGVQPEAWVLERDHQLDGPVVLARGEVEKLVLVAAEFRLDLFEMGHAFMLA